MLVLSRRKGESIMIGDDVEVRVLEICRHHVKLGLDAPRSLAVYRKEIYVQIREADKAAASSSDTETIGLDPMIDP